MGPERWSDDGSIRTEAARCPRPPLPDDLTASMFLCLKYLDVEQLDGWVASLAAIADPRWGAAVIAWLVGFESLCAVGIQQPVDLGSLPDRSPLLTWEGSYLLSGTYTGAAPTQPLPPFLPRESVEVFRESIDRHVDEGQILSWAVRFAEFPYLEDAAYWLPDELLALRRRRSTR